jgi:hypothetical protein
MSSSKSAPAPSEPESSSLPPAADPSPAAAVSGQPAVEVDSTVPDNESTYTDEV